MMDWGVAQVEESLPATGIDPEFKTPVSHKKIYFNFFTAYL
jgi:hypothetical protein